MRDLFVIDKQDYSDDFKVVARPSARGIIVRDGKVLLIRSEKYDYYKFPGGGINPGETEREALAREILEESGYRIDPDSVQEFGRVVRKQKGTNKPEDGSSGEDYIFLQENFYYFCEAVSEPKEQKLDDYEAEERFTPVWMDPFEASWLDSKWVDHTGKDYAGMVEREARVLHMVDDEIRRRDRERHECATVENMGIPELQEMLDFVQEELQKTNTEDIASKNEIAYSRFGHTKRVLGWALRLYRMCEHKEGLRYEDLMIATVFHDVGRAYVKSHYDSHALQGGPVVREYLKNHGFDPERTEYIASLVESHSDKFKMADPDLDPNLLYLMEADLLDDMGALGIVMDCMITEHRNFEATFADCLNHINRYTYRIQQENPCVSAEGRALWEEKRKLVNSFVSALTQDLVL